MPRLRDPQVDLFQLERRLRKVEDIRIQIRQNENRIGKVFEDINQLRNNREVVSINNMEFLWVAATSKITWVAGFVKDKDSTVFPIPSGEKTGLAASTEYWVGWNPLHQTMSFQTALESLTAIPNILIICRIETGAGVNGNAGGGGREDGNDGRSGDTYQFV